jgi:transcriptional regulator with XRE-family HTH domain
MKNTANNINLLRKQIGGRIKAIRRELQFTQEDFATRLRISNSNLSQVENGNLSPNFELLYNMAETFKVNLYHLIFGKGKVFKKGSPGDDVVDFPDLPGAELEFLEDFLRYFYRSKVVRYSFMAFFTTFLLQNRKLVEKEMGRQNNDNNQGHEQEQTGNDHTVQHVIIDNHNRKNIFTGGGD